MRIVSWLRPRPRPDPPDPVAWRDCLAGLPFVGGLDAAERERLRFLAGGFLADKHMSPAGGHMLTPAMCLSIAAQACLPVLELGLEYYRDWVEVVVYPAGFLPLQTWTDEAGVVHQARVPRMGEAWLKGPVVLSWEDVARAGEPGAPHVVIHEFAHKLDMYNGAADGYPPLHRGMDRVVWQETFSRAWFHFRRRLARGVEPAIDPYAAESPAEFFAVLSEVFFTDPAVVVADYPAVYAQLALFYRQDPLARLRRAEPGE